jgi:hypothetical protein
MGECVKCGFDNTEDAFACARCTWPFSLGAWRSTTFKIRRVTIDTGCINAKQGDPDLNTLERWAAEDKIVLERSDALLDELTGPDRVSKAMSMNAHPDVWILGVSQLGIDTVLAGPDLAGPFEETLFPTTATLTANQTADVAHLRSVVLTGSDMFVTKNPRDFIARGKQEALAGMGVWVFSPNELVQHLRNLYGWT